MQAVLEYYEKDISAIFRSYAAANATAAVADSSTLESLDIQELTYMMKEGGMLDERLTQKKLGDIFLEVSSAQGCEGCAARTASSLWLDLWRTVPTV